MIIYITYSEQDKIFEMNKDYAENLDILALWLEKLLGKHPFEAMMSVCKVKLVVCNKIPKEGRIKEEHGDIRHPINSLTF